MAHAGYGVEIGARDIVGGVPAPSNVQQRIVNAVDHLTGHGNGLQQGYPVAGFDDRGPLADPAAGAVAAVMGLFRHYPPIGLGRGILRRCQDPGGGDIGFDRALPRALVGTGAHQRRHRGRRPRRGLGIAALRHDRGHGAHPAAMFGGQDLHDGAAHGDAGHMRRLDRQGIHQADNIGGHVLDGVGNRNLAARLGLGQQRIDIGRACFVELGGQAHIAIVEDHHVKAHARQQPQQVFRPVDQLRAQTAHQD